MKYFSFFNSAYYIHIYICLCNYLPVFRTFQYDHKDNKVVMIEKRIQLLSANVAVYTAQPIYKPIPYYCFYYVKIIIIMMQIKSILFYRWKE